MSGLKTGDESWLYARIFPAVIARASDEQNNVKEMQLKCTVYYL